MTSILEEKILAKLDQLALCTGKNKAQLVREALKDYFKTQGLFSQDLKRF